MIQMHDLLAIAKFLVVIVLTDIFLIAVKVRSA